MQILNSPITGNPMSRVTLEQGGELVARLRAMRNELAEHPDRNLALAYLMH